MIPQEKVREAVNLIKQEPVCENYNADKEHAIRLLIEIATLYIRRTKMITQEQVREAIDFFDKRLVNFIRAEAYQPLAQEQKQNKEIFETALKILTLYSEGNLKEVETATKWALRWKDKYFESIKNILSDDELREIIFNCYEGTEDCDSFINEDKLFKSLQGKVPKYTKQLLSDDELRELLKDKISLCEKCDGNGTILCGWKEGKQARMLCNKCDGRGVIIDFKALQGRVARGLSIKEITSIFWKASNDWHNTHEAGEDGYMSFLIQTIYDAQKGKGK